MGPHPYCARSASRAGTSAPVPSDIVSLRRATARGGGFLPPLPAGDLRHVVAVAGDVPPVLDELVADGLLGVGGACPQLGHAVDDVLHEVEAVEVVQHAHVERRGGGALLLV